MLFDIDAELGVSAQALQLHARRKRQQSRSDLRARMRGGDRRRAPMRDPAGRGGNTARYADCTSMVRCDRVRNRASLAR